MTNVTRSRKVVFGFDVLWQPAARRAFDRRTRGLEPVPAELEWKVLPPTLQPSGPLTDDGARWFADRLAVDQECDVHVWSNLTPGDLWYHSYLDGRKGSGWSIDIDEPTALSSPLDIHPTREAKKGGLENG